MNSWFVLRARATKNSCSNFVGLRSWGLSVHWLVLRLLKVMSPQHTQCEIVVRAARASDLPARVELVRRGLTDHDFEAFLMFFFQEVIILLTQQKQKIIMNWQYYGMETCPHWGCTPLQAEAFVPWLTDITSHSLSGVTCSGSQLFGWSYHLQCSGLKWLITKF